MGIAGIGQATGDFQEYANIVGAAAGVVLGPIDASLFRSGSLQVAGSGNASFTVQGANSLSGPFQSVTALSVNLVNGGHTLLAPGDLYQFPVTYRYLQISCTFTSGVINGTLELYTEPLSSTAILLAAGFSTIGFVGINAGNQNIGTVQLAKNQGTVAAGVGAAAVVIKASAGYLSGVLVTSAATAALNIFDNASAGSGTLIGFVPATATAGQYFPFNMPALNGITAEQANGSPAVTVAFD